MIIEAWWARILSETIILLYFRGSILSILHSIFMSLVHYAIVQKNRCLYSFPSGKNASLSTHISIASVPKWVLHLPQVFTSLSCGTFLKCSSISLTELNFSMPHCEQPTGRDLKPLFWRLNPEEFRKFECLLFDFIEELLACFVLTLALLISNFQISMNYQNTTHILRSWEIGEDPLAVAIRVDGGLFHAVDG